MSSRETGRSMSQLKKTGNHVNSGILSTTLIFARSEDLNYPLGKNKVITKRLSREWAYLQLCGPYILETFLLIWLLSSRYLYIHYCLFSGGCTYRFLIKKLLTGNQEQRHRRPQASPATLIFYSKNHCSALVLNNSDYRRCPDIKLLHWQHKNRPHPCKCEWDFN